MIRNKVNSKRITGTDLQLSAKGAATLSRIEAIQRFMPSNLSRASLALRMGQQYKGVRRVYEALGYPEDSELTFSYFLDKWDRQDIATSVINKPVNKTWSGDLNVTEEGAIEGKSTLSVEWKELDKRLKVKRELVKLDALDGIGQYSLLLFGFNDVKSKEQFERPAGAKLKLNYIRAISEGTSKIVAWEEDSSNERFGQPKFYELEIAQPTEHGNVSLLTNIKVHHSRILHIASGSLTSNVYGRSRLKSIINRLEDLEKLLGGSAEMYWRGARPGYHAKPEANYKMTTETEEALDEELDKYEHDLRRIIYAQGVDLKALDMQIADPKGHVEVQHEAIAAETGIPKRILVGSERGELSSSQDKDQWLGLIVDRRENYAEPEIFEPFLDKCMAHGILTMHDMFTIIWSDLFAQSEKEKVDIGKVRADSLESYLKSPIAVELFPIELAIKHFLGLNKDQIEEFMKNVDAEALEEDLSMRGAEEEIEEAENNTTSIVRTRSNGVN